MKKLNNLDNYTTNEIKYKEKKEMMLELGSIYRLILLIFHVIIFYKLECKYNESRVFINSDVQEED